MNVNSHLQPAVAAVDESVTMDNTLSSKKEMPSRTACGTPSTRTSTPALSNHLAARSAARHALCLPARVYVSAFSPSATSSRHWPPRYFTIRASNAFHAAKGANLALLWIVGKTHQAICRVRRQGEQRHRAAGRHGRKVVSLYKYCHSVV